MGYKRVVCKGLRTKVVAAWRTLKKCMVAGLCIATGLCVAGGLCGTVGEYNAPGKNVLSQAEVFFESEAFGATHVSAETDYNKYPTRKICWGLNQNTKHLQPTAELSAKVLKKYDAYYVSAAQKDEKVIFLTFDCGYENGNTGKILDILKKNHIKAIFFVTEPYVKGNVKLVKRMKKEGHLVGNHTKNHPSLATKSDAEVRRELKSCAKTMKELTGYRIDRFMRPPMGEFSERTLKVIQDMGYKTILWSMALYDYDTSNQPGKTYVKDYFAKRYHNGAIPLLHVISKSDTEALPDVIRSLKKKGYRFGRLDEVARKKGKVTLTCQKKVESIKELKPKIKTTNKDAEVTYTYYNKKGKIIKKPKKKGTYYIQATVAATEEYNEAVSDKVKFKIVKA
ncbi:MAG: polysaccharide deacetylase family protein [Lachnospiraceae bacterium]|nr:polysaccharide deacetylase family protein [Lachnospiraceae bacterium]